MWDWFVVCYVSDLIVVIYFIYSVMYKSVLLFVDVFKFRREF